VDTVRVVTVTGGFRKISGANPGDVFVTFNISVDLVSVLTFPN